MSNKTPVIIIFIASILFFTLSLWKITEQDIFWQIRAGDEIIKTLKVQTSEEWSYTVKGEPWYNFQWLSTIIIRLIYGIGAHGENSLIVFRAFVIFILFIIIGLILNKIIPKEISNLSRSALIFFLLLTVYIGSAFRLQMRSEIFIFVIYSGVLSLWFSEISNGYKQIFLIIACILASNLHTGSAPFPIGLAVLSIITSKEMALRNKIFWSLLCLITIFSTPYTYKAIPILYKHVFYSSYNILVNPDHQPLSLRHFKINEFGLGGIACGFLFLTGWLGFILSIKPYSSSVVDRIFTGLFGIFLTVMSINRIRTLPYFAIFFVPLTAHLLGLFFRWVYNRNKIISTLLSTFILFLSFIILLVHIDKFRLPWGFGLSETTYPIGSVNFIKKHNLKKNIYHGFTYGHYLTWNLIDYPLFCDTREVPFWKLQKTILSAYSSPEVTQNIYKKYNVNIVLSPIPQTQYIQGVGFIDVVERYNPKSEWATVYFDNISVLSVRRSKEDEKVINSHEYLILKPNLPPNNYPYSTNKASTNNQRFEFEISMCLRDEPKNAFCKMAKAAWLMTKSNNFTSNFTKAKELLENIENRLIRKEDRLYYYVLLLEIYDKLGKEEKAEKIKEMLGTGFPLSRE